MNNPTDGKPNLEPLYHCISQGVHYCLNEDALPKSGNGVTFTLQPEYRFDIQGQTVDAILVSWLSANRYRTNTDNLVFYHKHGRKVVFDNREEGKLFLRIFSAVIDESLVDSSLYQ